jgi:hypothetical protein
MARPRSTEPRDVRLRALARQGASARARAALRGRPRFHYACLCVWPVSL